MDIKDLNDDIYFSYTGRHNDTVLENIRKLSSVIGKENLTIRVPHIIKFNRKADMIKTKKFAEQYGRIDEFVYKTGRRKEGKNTKKGVIVI